MLLVGRPLALMFVVAALSISSSSRAQQKCPGGRFVLTAPAEAPIERTLLVIDADGRPAGVTGCRKIESQKATKKWPMRAKLSDCASRPTQRRLKGRWTSDCREIEVRIRSKQLRRNLIAKPSVCGDGVIDGILAEQCETSADCRVGARCDEICRCRLPATTTTLTSVSTTTSSTIPGEPALLAPGDVVTVDPEGDGVVARFRIHLDAPTPVFLRATELTALHRPPCIEIDASEVPGCGSRELPLPLMLAAGDVTLRVPWTRGTPFAVQYLPLAAGLTAPVPMGPDAFIDAALPALGLLDAHAVPVVDGPRRVFVRLLDLDDPASFQPCIQVLEQGENPALASSRCVEQAPILNLSLPTGTHFVVVSDRFHDSEGAYRLQVMQLHPDFAPELTPAPRCDALDDRNDLDVYRFTVSADDTPVSLVLEANGTNAPDFKPCLRLWDGANGPLLYGDPGCTGPVTLEQTLDAGTYYVTVHDDFRTSAGGYCLTRE